MNIYPYVYICTHKITGEFYIGCRYANKVPAIEDFPNYKTSSKKVKPRFTEFDWMIVAEFFTREAAYDFEQLLIFESIHNPLVLNGNCFHEKRRWLHQKHDELTKEKIRQAHLGKPKPPLTDAHKEKLKIAAKTRPPRLKHTDEARRKMADAHKTRVYGPRKPYRTRVRKIQSEAS